MMASLDHACWFHEPFRADEWLLYELEAGKTGFGRGFSAGRVWTLDGRLVMRFGNRLMVVRHRKGLLGLTKKRRRIMQNFESGLIGLQLKAWLPLTSSARRL